MAFDTHAVYSVAFYNLENLFDTEDDPRTLDDDFTKESPRAWNEKRYHKKLKKLGKVITQIGYDDIQHPPVIVGIAEVENEKVVQDLIASKYLRKKGYDYVHFDSSDERGIDTALLYRSNYFSVTKATTHTLYVENEPGVRDFTRDILHVEGMLHGHRLHLLVNHWPSRRQGAEETSYKRVAAAEKNLEILSEITQQDPLAKCVVMGDFNDDPQSESLKTLTRGTLFNPMETLLTREAGSLTHRGAWNLFDQILITYNFLQAHQNEFRFEQAKIFNKKSLQEFTGKYKGSPFRTYAGTKYLGGMSDHFPVYALFTIK
ncbi:endonuclease/exonuclease/phosphatase family protein [Altibacter sp. HG106]|uniref:endonuclease/exonuclease/phosphatase family protein n=1 Tax=Altibacter sp. HG106 TaxID=3023937 RepID=UPI00234FBFF4|nr:endonuclease/exonuclease/phosphatase family protein [Altibacter sp. HG106]MDC7995138.1 endonuclease [Altibacter sp. HG106]